MGFLFNHTICDWQSWANISQSIDVFQDLINEIFIREHIDIKSPVENLTPSTNAVFKVGNYVIKIFAPMESGVNPETALDMELMAMKHAVSAGIHAPNVIAAGALQDRYLFRYIITDYINGLSASKVLPTYTANQKTLFVSKLKHDLSLLHVDLKDFRKGYDIKKNAIYNSRWTIFPQKFQDEVQKMILSLPLSKGVFVHGDLNGENVIIADNGDTFIIDYGDSIIAPVEYEYPSIVFGLFKADRQLVREFMEGMSYTDFIEKLFTGVLLHDFGGDFVRYFYTNLLGRSIDELDNPQEIKQLLYQYWQ